MVGSNWWDHTSFTVFSWLALLFGSIFTFPFYLGTFGASRSYEILIWFFLMTSWWIWLIVSSTSFLCWLVEFTPIMSYGHISIVSVECWYLEIFFCKILRALARKDKNFAFYVNWEIKCNWEFGGALWAPQWRTSGTK